MLEAGQPVGVRRAHMTLPTIQDNIDLAPGDELILRFRTWDDYENLLARRQDKAGLRIRYNSVT